MPFWHDTILQNRDQYITYPALLHKSLIVDLCQIRSNLERARLAQHRPSCKTVDRPARMLEVAFGNWQQDDITRYVDDFNGAPTTT